VFCKDGVVIHGFSGNGSMTVSDLFFGFPKFWESGFAIYVFSENGLMTGLMTSCWV